MLYSDFIETVIGELGRDNSDIRSKFDEWTNTEIHEVYKEVRPWLGKRTWERTVTQGKRSYPIPELLSTDALFYFLTSDGGTWKEIDVKSERTAIMAFAPNDDGEPKIIVIGKKSFSVFPLPDTTYTLRYSIFSYEEPLTTTGASGRESDLINECPRLVELRVLKRGFQFLQEYDFASALNQDIDAEMKKFKKQNVRKILSGVTSIWPTENAKGLETR